MKRLLAFAVGLLAFSGIAQAKFIADPIVRYNIDARLDVNAKTVAGHEVIIWKNHTADTIPDLQFHLYLNAFKNNYSTFMRESGGRNRSDEFHAGPQNWGYEQIKSMKVDGQDLTGKVEFIAPDDGNTQDQTVARVVLPKPIGPGQSVTIDIDWTSKLPMIFARTGFHNNYFLVAQWFPKPGVYEAAGERHRPHGGWNCHQFHSSTEFYADYGTWDVSITVPTDFAFGSSGVEVGSKTNGDRTTTHVRHQEDTHDFAWVTQPASQVDVITRTFKADEQTTPAEVAEWAQKTGATIDQENLRDVHVTLFLQKEHHDQADRHFKAAFNGIKWFGLWYGQYPYDTLTVVDPAHGARGSGGMEYPTFITAGTQFWPAAKALSPEGVVVHEFGHQFWYGLVGNNEFEEAWLDEGFNSYSTSKVLERAYGPNYDYHRLWGIPVSGIGWLGLPVPRYPWWGVEEVAIGPYWEDVPYPEQAAPSNYAKWATADQMERYAWLDLNSPSYGVEAYSKPQVTLRTLDALLGDTWPRVIRAYQQRYRYKHPDAIDFMNTVNEVSGRDMKWFFDQTVYGAGILNYSVSFTNDNAPPQKGYFGNDTKPKNEKDQHKGAVESQILVRRLGEMQFPVTIRVKFEDGSTTTEHWDGLYRWTKIKYTGRPKIVSAEIDPDYQWSLEPFRTDDSYRAQPVALASQKWYLRWTVWLQNVFMSFSFFS